MGVRRKPKVGNPMRNVFCAGELLIDFVCKDIGVTLAEGMHFEKKAGGAPANVAAAVAKLGGNAFFMGKVGEDAFGTFLERTLQEAKVNTSMLTKGGHTTLAFVSIASDGERDFIFQRGADGEYSFANIDLEKLASSDILHLGSATAWLPGELKETYYQLLAHAKKQGIFLSFDPNYRSALIVNREEFRENCLEFAAQADFVKMSEEEAKMIGKTDDLHEAVEMILKAGAKILCVTLGAKGTLLATNERKELLPSIPIKQVDSTGAGDAFVGAMLYQFSHEVELADVQHDFAKLAEFVCFANKVGAITCTNFGAISSMPSLHEVTLFKEGMC